MKKSISPCYVVPVKGQGSRVRWRIRENDSEPMVPKGISWPKHFRTDRLKELCNYSKYADTGRRNWRNLKSKHFVRSAGCETIDDFRMAVIKEIERHKSKLSAEQQRGLDRVRNGMNPPKRKTAQFSHELTPSVKAWGLFVDTRIKFNDLIKSADKWDRETRNEVIESIEKLETFLAGEKRKL
jgi:hypothetical protein